MKEINQKKKIKSSILLANMPTTCQFKFSRTTPIYYSGEQISGLIVLSSTKLLAIEGEYFSFAYESDFGVWHIAKSC